MDSLIRETNENLKAIIDTMKSNLDNSINTLDNIQIQMDKKVEEAKKYKIQVDNAKEKIKGIEDENKVLESSLKELNDKYGKMNLVSVIEAGNREIKTKINDNNREINKQKEHIADLTNKARTIKDLLINLKKDKNIKEERLENIKVVYEYYNERINDVMDYAFNHSENLNDYKENYTYSNVDYDDTEEVEINSDLENTMVFDEIANIDENKNFKDEMSFINEQIDDTINSKDKINEIIRKSLEKYNLEDKEEIIEENIDKEEIKEVEVKEDNLDTTQVFDSIFEPDDVTEEEKKELSNENEYEKENETEKQLENIEKELASEEIVNIEEANNNGINDFKEVIPSNIEENVVNISETLNTSKENNSITESLKEFEPINTELFINNDNDKDINEVLTPTEENNKEYNFNELENNINNLDILNIEKNNPEDTIENENYDNEDRINKINDLFNSIDNTNINKTDLNVEPVVINGIEQQIDNAYIDVFGKPLEEEDLNKKETTLTDIFGNPIKNEELSEEIKINKKIEELFLENGIDFNKFKDDEKNYLKQIYNEEKFNNIINTLKRNKINLNNLYNSFNIFGEISANELENIIIKLINSGQSVEAIGLVLEKLPKVKKYNLSEAIMSYGDYIKDIDITELIMKAKELYNNGGNI